MTENEAIEFLKREKRQNEMVVILPGSDIGNTVIKALEEVQQYRDTTLSPKQIRALKNRIVDVFLLVGKYMAIGTPEECLAAIEKQKAQKSDLEGGRRADGHIVYDTWICPGCGERYEVEYDKYEYCPHCGQKISWEDGD